ncbi:hypothetical protein TruAng_004761 [Truncatella angustata]|nr:hypothetical protein TruAng_004761 [Truncatella angustata]
MTSSQYYHRLYPTGKEDDNNSGVEDLDSRSLTYLQRFRNIQVVVIALLFISNVAFAGLWLNSQMQGTQQKASDCVRPQLTFSPAISAIRYEKKRLWRDIDGPNPFTGKPRPEFDKAWRDIIAPLTIKVHGDELERFSEGDTTLAFKDGSGYIAEMGVYHELHCVCWAFKKRSQIEKGKMLTLTTVSNIGESPPCVEATQLLEPFSGEMVYRPLECTQTMSVWIGRH